MKTLKIIYELSPSSGDGCFFDLLPKNKRIGIDLEPRRSDLIKSDFLKFELPKNKFIVIGNPPFKIVVY